MSRAGDKQRRWRSRCRRGAIVARVEIGPPVVEALILSRRLDEAEALDRHQIEQAVAAFLDRWAREWAN